MQNPIIERKVGQQRSVRCGNQRVMSHCTFSMEAGQNVRAGPSARECVRDAQCNLSPADRTTSLWQGQHAAAYLERNAIRHIDQRNAIPCAFQATEAREMEDFQLFLPLL